ncbi:FliH/SctL family protein [Desulforhopalus sp. 52FAK]
MSWSKYYKDSNSFKREKIVQSAPTDAAGWQSKPKSTTTPFEPGKVRQDPVQQEATPTPDPQSTPQDPTAHSAPGDEKKPKATPEAPPVDLTQYILIDEAKNNAEARYQQGLQDGISKAAEDYGSAVSALTSSCEQLDSVRETIIGNSSHELLEFTLLLAEKILRISLKEQDQTIVATIEEALLRAVKSDEFTVFINPADYEKVQSKSDDFIAGVSGLNNIVIKADPTVEEGGAKIESENCIIDATIFSQLETIREELLKKKP